MAPAGSFLALIAVVGLAACGDERVGTDDDVHAGPAASGPGPGSAGSGGGDGGSAGDGGGGGGTGGDGAVGWRTLAPLPGGPRQEHGVVARRGEVWALGGIDASGITTDLVEIYDPEDDAWREGPSLPGPMHHPNAAVVGERLLILGSLEGLAFDASPATWELDDTSGVWEPRAPLDGERARGASAVAVVGDQVVVCGGLRGAAVSTCDVYDAGDDVWRPLPDLPVVRDHLVGAAIAGRVLVVGGRAGTIDSVGGEVWELADDAASWIERAPMPTARGGAAGAPLGGLLYVAGGEGNPLDPLGVFDDLEVYDPVRDAWESLEPMPTPRHGAGAAAVRGMIVLPGGADAEAFAAVDVVEAYVPAR